MIDDARKSIHDQFTQNVGLSIKADQLDKYPGFSIRKLEAEEKMGCFKDVILSIATQLRQLVV